MLRQHDDLRRLCRAEASLRVLPVEAKIKRQRPSVANTGVTCLVPFSVRLQRPGITFESSKKTSSRLRFHGSERQVQPESCRLVKSDDDDAQNRKSPPRFRSSLTRLHLSTSA